jgi:putative tryptophan/tyrosine transport system substrate-binding protein
MTRASTLTLLALALVAAPLVAEAEQAGKLYRIGFLDASPRTASSARIESFQAALRELGYVEGRNVKIDWRFGEGTEAGLPDLAAELVGLKPDVLVSLSSYGMGALQSVAAMIPIVMAGAERRAMPENLARPSGNITGVASASGGLEGKRMELLREAVPAASRVAIFQDAVNWPYRPGESAPSRAERWGVTFIQIKVRGPDDFESAFAIASTEKAGGLTVLNTPLFYTHRRRLAELAARHRVAWIAGYREYPEAGCLMSYGPDGREMARHAAIYVDKILKGRKVADLPVEQPTKFELVINLKTAKAIGLTIPPAVLARADEVIE